ncbi:MAG: energy transducer TonB [Bacteroidia bacterium]|nr:energy transducer TonB [Bacteroidia bacterium]
MVNEKEHTRVWLPAILTIVAHALLVLLMIFYIIRTPNPPYPDGGGPGMEVNLGFSDNGMGDIQPETYNPNPNPNNNQEQAANNVQASDDNVLTQNSEEAIAIKANPKDKNKTNNSNTTTQPQINEPSVNPLALFKATSGGSEGETGKPGDQGNPNGDLNAKNHIGDPGNGNRPGNGGNFYNLGNRKMVGTLPKPNYPGNEQGKVVVEIFVDRSGVVTKATAGVKGSTLLSKNYLDAAYNAAFKAKFDPNPDATELQRGTITYNFMLQ